MNSRFGYFDFCWCALGMGCAVEGVYCAVVKCFLRHIISISKDYKMSEAEVFTSIKKCASLENFCWLKYRGNSRKILRQFDSILLKRRHRKSLQKKQIFQSIKRTANLILPINQSWWWLYRRTAIKVLNELTQVPGHVRIRSIARVVRSNHF